MNIAIVGATGNVGRKVLEVLELKKFPIDQLYLVASSKSVGKKLILMVKTMRFLILRHLILQMLKLLFLQQVEKYLNNMQQKQRNIRQ